MEKLTLFKGRIFACLILMCLLLAQACRKDRGYLPEPEIKNGQLIQHTAIIKWFETSKYAQLVALDWKKAKQGIVDGKNVVRIPTLNVDKITKLGNLPNLKNNSLSSNGISAGISNKAAATGNSDNVNYNPAHPPELFLIQDGPSGRINSFLLNFIPKSKNSDAGENGIWTGKLLEWNLEGDTVLVQQLEKSIVKDFYAMKVGASSPSNLQSIVKKNKLQSLTSIKNKQVSGFFGWLIDKLGEFIGWAGSAFGLSTYQYYTYDAYNDSFDSEWRLDIDFSWLTGSGTPTTPGNPVTIPPRPLVMLYTGAGLPIYESYAIGYNGGGGGNPGSYNPNDPNNFEPSPIDYGEGPIDDQPHGPNVNFNNLSAQYLVNEGWLTGDANISYINSHKEIADAFVTYTEKIVNRTQSDIDFINWAIIYLSGDDSRFNQEFRNFLNSSDDAVGENEDYNSSLNLVIPSNLTTTFSSNGFGVHTTNGLQTDTYPETHPVSIAIANYNEWIYRALIGANNTSVKHMHLNSKGLSGSDAYAKGIGAIGEGIFAQRVTTEYPTSPGGNMYIGYYINTTHIDALQEHFLPAVGGSYYGLQVNYTDIYGNPLSKKMEYPDPNHSTTLEKGRIAYEIKTNSANRNSESTLYQTFLLGINQTVHRANISGIDAGVLVMDFDAWKKLINSSYNQQVISRLNEVYNIKNSKNEQKIYLRIEKNLWSDANKAYWDILGRIKNL
ncbi:hypothetical protein SAMN04488511_102313 [Pedobacter suwonensis]|uniref:Uncharacterized protein n=1 Tax=Pedobacter suwonensis TaxID=332999 RepID=A0A1I0SRK2_9SPHI|nr:hypothetical protein [Pedobacter suwonensis]SFA41396.1 hypothetical protein SAMN04488511_102313 [Pedobacter suwonensis]